MDCDMWDVLVLCELHIIALILKEAFQSLVPWAITGILHTGLAVQLGEQMAKFRTCLYQEIYDTLDIKWGSPPASAVAYRTRMIKLFMQSCTKLSRVLAQCLPNGDWRNPVRVEWYPPMRMYGDFDEVAKSTVAHLLALGLLRAFLPQVLKVFARHHWTGLDIALDQQGALESCSRLMSRTTKRFLDFRSDSSAPAPPRVDVAALAYLAEEAPQPIADNPAADPGPTHPANAEHVSAVVHDGDKKTKATSPRKTRSGANI